MLRQRRPVDAYPAARGRGHGVRAESGLLEQPGALQYAKGGGKCGRLDPSRMEQEAKTVLQVGLPDERGQGEMSGGTCAKPEYPRALNWAGARSVATPGWDAAAFIRLRSAGVSGRTRFSSSER